MKNRDSKLFKIDYRKTEVLKMTERIKMKGNGRVMMDLSRDHLFFIL